MVFSLVTYLVTLTISWAALTGAETILLSEQPRIPIDQALLYANAIALALSITLLLRFIWRARRGPVGLLSGIGARRVRREDFPLTFDALDDMKIAAGLPMIPPVYMLDRLTVNAAMFMNGRELAVLVTYGFATKLTASDQRAVFASLLGRQVFARLYGLQAIDNVITHENEVVFGQGSGPLFYCWPREPVGFLTDPEVSRVGRLRELVGAEGIDV